MHGHLNVISLELYPLPVARRLLAVVSVSLALEQRYTFNPLRGYRDVRKQQRVNGRGSLGEVRYTLFPKGGVRTILLEVSELSPSRPYDKSNMKMETFAS